MGSIAMDKQGNMAAGYSASSSTVFPGIRYAGRLITDPLNQFAQGEAVLQDGNGSQLDSGSRWGDYTSMNDLRITVGGEPFDHLVYHFVLTASNWEHVTLCFSESFASLSEGLQNALWELGGVPLLHRTDRMTAAVNNLTDLADFQKSYEALLRHYGMEGRKIQTGQANENGDIEQRHHRFKRALDQALMLRGNRDFTTTEQYQGFLAKLSISSTADEKKSSPVRWKCSGHGPAVASTVRSECGFE